MTKLLRLLEKHYLKINLKKQIKLAMNKKEKSKS